MAKKNDRSLRAFLLQNILQVDFYEIERYGTFFGVFEELRKGHKKLGLYAQSLLIKRLLEIDFNTPMTQTL
jgi:hypothetical protein